MPFFLCFLSHPDSARIFFFFNFENKSAILKELFYLTLIMCFGQNYIFK